MHATTDHFVFIGMSRITKYGPRVLCLTTAAAAATTAYNSQAAVAAKAEPKANQSIVVVGAGVVGLASAYYLSRAGHRVVCIEAKDDVGLVASYRNGAAFCPAMLTSWASLSQCKVGVRALFFGDKKFQVEWNLFTDPKFWWWGIYYTLSCTPSISRYDHCDMVSALSQRSLSVAAE